MFHLTFWIIIDIIFSKGKRVSITSENLAPHIDDVLGCEHQQARAAVLLILGRMGGRGGIIELLDAAQRNGVDRDAAAVALLDLSDGEEGSPVTMDFATGSVRLLGEDSMGQ